MAQIIISHAETDEAWATLVSTRLSKLGYNVRQEPGGPAAASPMSRRKLESEIAGASCVLVLWSRDAAETPGLLDVAARARAAGKLTLARLDESAPPSRIGAAKASLTHWIGRPDTRGWRALAAEVAAKARPIAAVSRAASAPSAAPAPVRQAAPAAAATIADVSEKKKGGAGGLIALLLILLIAGGGAAYYFLTQAH